MIQVKIDKLTSDLKTLKAAIKDFEPYTQDFATQCMSELEGQNSDFISEVKDTLKSMADTKAPQLLEKINNFHDKGVFVVSKFKEKDEEIAASEKLDW